jgi:hypothetical protein
MKTILRYGFIFMVLIFLSCEYKDEDNNKNCDDAYMLKLVICRTLSGKDRSNCFFEAAAIIYACDPESYWKLWGCEDGKPCM